MAATKMLARTTLAGLLAFSLALAGCSGGSSTGDAGPAGPPGPPGPGTDPDAAYLPLPGVVIAITSVTGANGPGGVFLPGNTPTVHFTVKTTAGDDLDLADMATGEIYLSGPSVQLPARPVRQPHPVRPAHRDVRGRWQLDVHLRDPDPGDLPPALE